MSACSMRIISIYYQVILLTLVGLKQACLWIRYIEMKNYEDPVHLLIVHLFYIYSLPLTWLDLQQNVPEISLGLTSDLALIYESAWSVSLGFSYMPAINLNYTNWTEVDA